MNRGPRSALLLGLLLLACGSGTPASGGASDCDTCKAPAIPHPVQSTEDSGCVGCHGSGEKGAPKTQHPDRAGCVNCHAAKQ